MKKLISMEGLSALVWLAVLAIVGKIYLDFASVGGYCLGWAPGCLPMSLINLIFGAFFILWTLFILGINLLFKYLRSRKIKPSTK